MEAIVKQAEEHGAKVTWNGRMGDNQSPKGGIYTNPAIIDWTGVSDTNKKEIKALMEEETFAPLLHVVKKVKSVEEAATITNELDKEKLSASIFTKVDAEFDKFSDKVSCHSITRNDAPKDQSPGGKHGNYGHHAKGGDNSLEGFVVEKTGTYTRDHASAVLNYESNIYGSRGNELGFAA